MGRLRGPHFFGSSRSQVYVPIEAWNGRQSAPSEEAMMEQTVSTSLQALNVMVESEKTVAESAAVGRSSLDLY